LFGSVDVSTQVPPHETSGVTHWQEPDKHAVPPPQAWPHEPQLALSELRSTHPPLQALRGVVQEVVHTPELHTWLLLHAVVQLPQWFGSAVVSTQALPQTMLPAGHVHVLPEQICVAPQAIPQLPQWAGSLVRSVHAPLQL
jgi:hypothetical protein